MQNSCNIIHSFTVTFFINLMHPSWIKSIHLFKKKMIDNMYAYITELLTLSVREALSVY